MKRLNKTALALVTAGVLSSGVAQAALNDRGGGLLYDDVLKITWLQDANYAKTSSYDTDGRMNWSAANTWAASLSYGGYDDWRLAANMPVGPGWNYDESNDGSTDVGYNITSPHSELSYMYYVNLGLKGYYDTSGAYQSDWGVLGNGTWGGQKDLGPVKNLQAYVYWSGTAYAPNPANSAWDFHPDGYQYYYPQYYEFHAWAVRDGDVAAVPEPEVYALLLAGLGMLGFMARRRKQHAA